MVLTFQLSANPSFDGPAALGVFLRPLPRVCKPRRMVAVKSLGASPKQVVSLVQPRQIRQEALGQAAVTTGAAASW